MRTDTPCNIIRREANLGEVQGRTIPRRGMAAQQSSQRRGRPSSRTASGMPAATCMSKVDIACGDAGAQPAGSGRASQQRTGIASEMPSRTERWESFFRQTRIVLSALHFPLTRDEQGRWAAVRPFSLPPCLTVQDTGWREQNAPPSAELLRARRSSAGTDLRSLVSCPSCRGLC